MLFAMKELGGLEAVLAQPGNEEVTSELVETILDEAAKFASNVLAPINAQGDTQGCRWNNGVVTTADGFKQAYAGFCETGWNGMPAGTEFGGQGLPTLVSTAVLEMWKASNMAFSLCQMLTLGAVEAITHHARDELKQRYLPAMIEGRWTGTMNITEPQAGSDLGRHPHQGRPGRRPLPHQRHQDLHHLGRARHGAEHHSPRAGAPARCACRRERHLAVPVPEVPRQRRWLPGRAQRPRVRVDRTQDGHPRQRHRGDGVRRRRGRHRLAGRRAQPGPGVHVHDDEPRSPERRARRSGHLGARLPAGPPVRARPRAGQDAGPRSARARPSSATPTCAEC